MWDWSYCLRSFCQVITQYTTVIELFRFASSCKCNDGYFLDLQWMEISFCVRLSFSFRSRFWIVVFGIWLLSGRFDFHVELPAPAVSERGAILKHEIQKRSLQCPDEILLDVASKCDGYDAYDLVCGLFESYSYRISYHCFVFVEGIFHCKTWT